MPSFFDSLLTGARVKSTTVFQVTTMAAAAALMCWFPSTLKERGILAKGGLLATFSFVLGAKVANGTESAAAGTRGTPAGEVNVEGENSILEATKMAARWMTTGTKKWRQGKVFMDLCAASCPTEAALNSLRITAEQWRHQCLASIQAQLQSDDSLKSFRWINQSTFPMDGWTPLHYAAFKGNIEVIEILLEAGVSVWSVDFQGRTALALAAEGGHANATLLLKGHMENGSGCALVGTKAPVDFAGRTPLGSCNRVQLPDEVKRQLYARGDASICPATPPTERSSGGVSTGHRRRGLALLWGHSTAPGMSRHMQDELCCHDPIDTNEPGAAMLGVFDGHGSSNFTSAFAAKELKNCFLASEGWTSSDRRPCQLTAALKDAFVTCDARLALESRMGVTERIEDGRSFFKATDTSGSTGVVALITATHVFVANAGDSRAILINARMRHGGGVGRGYVGVEEVTVTPMSYDHTASDPQERERIASAGGTPFEVYCKGQDGTVARGWRTSYNDDKDGHSLSPSRGFGDFFYKQKRDAAGNLRAAENQVVSVVPDIMIHERGSSSDEEYILLASDGLWDVLSNEEAGRFFVSVLPAERSFEQVTGEDIALACDALVDECLRRGSHDNLTAQAVWMGRVTPAAASGSELSGIRRALFNS